MGDMVKVYGLGGASIDGVSYEPEADGGLLVPATAAALLVHAHGASLTAPEAPPKAAPVVVAPAPKEEPAAEEPKPRKGTVINEGIVEGVRSGEGRRKR